MSSRFPRVGWELLDPKARRLKARDSRSSSSSDIKEYPFRPSMVVSADELDVAVGIFYGGLSGLKRG